MNISRRGFFGTLFAPIVARYLPTPTIAATAAPEYDAAKFRQLTFKGIPLYPSGGFPRRHAPLPKTKN